MAHVEIEAKGVRARIDLLFGMISELVVERDGRKVSMLHKAPWLGEKMPEDAAPHLGGLAGDFFCAPFGDASADNAPGHGWPANRPGSHLGTERKGSETVARFRLDRKAMGADLVKELRLVDGHPFLYQRHIFTGGHAEGMSVANHAMVSLPEWRPAELFAKALVGDAADAARARSGARALAARMPDQDDRSPAFSARRRRRGRHHTLSVRLAPRGFRHRRRGGRQPARLDDAWRAARRAISSSACATRRDCR